MRNKFLAAIFIFLLSCNQQLKKEKDESKDHLIALCDNVMDYFTKEDYSAAMKILKQNSLLGSEAVDSLEKTVTQQMNSLDNRYGKVYSFKHIEDKSIDDLITKRTYLLLFEGNYLKFDFTLYKSKFGWKITTFEYSPETDNLFK